MRSGPAPHTTRSPGPLAAVQALGAELRLPRGSVCRRGGRHAHRDLAQGHGRRGISRSLRSSLSQRNELMLVSDHLEQQVFPFREHFPLLVEIFKTIVYGGDIREDMVEQPLF